MHLDLGIAAAGLGVGFIVGLTGMGGGALMTPLLVLVFKVQPLAAVSSDLVASFVMKPIGAGGVGASAVRRLPPRPHRIVAGRRRARRVRRRPRLVAGARRPDPPGAH